MYYKHIDDNNILDAIGESSIVSEPNVEITAEEYNSIMDIIRNKPEDTDEVIYKLHADTMEYVAEERPIEPEPEEPNNDYGIPNETYNSIIDDYTMSLIEEGVIE